MKWIFFAFFMLFCGSAVAQSDDSEQDTTRTARVSYVPKIDGAVKVKLEVDLQDAAYRFNVRNSRFGVRGNVSKSMYYRIQVDFNNEGKISILDSYVGYTIGGFDAKLGQQQYHFSTDLDRGPTTNMFANRSFLAKYLTSYYGSEVSDGKIVSYVKTLGSRDLGLSMSYRFKTDVPLNLIAGVFNGSGTNNPEWGKRVNLMGRIELGGDKGLQGSVAYYHGYSPQHVKVEEQNGTFVTEDFEQKLRMVGGELRYTRGGLLLEGEYARRYLCMEGATAMMATALVQGYYRFQLPKCPTIDYIAPIARWDMGNNVDYLNVQNKLRETFEANRITVGVNIGFGTKWIQSEIRLNYEKYLLKEQPSDFWGNKLLHDKFTLEVVASF
ncbi:MAG TPA: hypothetical protein IAA13_07530 [Candidatus Alistipes merdigallinarum]|nr:hypothetical protein [Candidatus Alistipes merdigallinarum]